MEPEPQDIMFSGCLTICSAYVHAGEGILSPVCRRLLVNAAVAGDNRTGGLRWCKEESI